MWKMLLINTVKSNHSLKNIKGSSSWEGESRVCFVLVLPGLENPAGTSLLKKSKNKTFVNELKQEETSTILTTAH